jgi:hypothetical protein
VFAQALCPGPQSSDDVSGLNSGVTQRDRPRPAGIFGPVIGRPDGSRPAGEACRLVSRAETSLAPTPAQLAYTADIPLEHDLKFSFYLLLYTIVDEHCKCNYSLCALRNRTACPLGLEVIAEAHKSWAGMHTHDRCKVGVKDLLRLHLLEGQLAQPVGRFRRVGLHDGQRHP